MSLSCSRFAGVVWVVVLTVALAVQSCSALDQPRSFLALYLDEQPDGALPAEPMGVERGGMLPLTETATTTSESKEPAMDKILPQLVESIGAAVNTLVLDGFVKTTTALRGDSQRRELQSVNDNDLDAAQRLLQSGGGGLLAQIGTAIIPIVVTAVAEIIISTIGLGGLAGQLTSAIVLAVSGVISAAILSILFGGGGRLQDFVTTTFNQKLPTSPSVTRRKFKLFPNRPKLLPVVGSLESRKFAQLLSKAIDSVTMPGLPKLKLPLDDSVASVQLLSTTMNNLNLTLDVSTVNATALGETMLAIIAGLPLGTN
jgi:hypothetical protein